MPETQASDHPNLNPRNMHELSDGEVILIRAMRHWALAKPENNHFQSLLEEWRSTFAHDHGGALSAAIDLLREIAKGSRRTIRHHTPGCPCFSADEIALVTLVAAVQAHEAGLARKLSLWIVAADRIADVLAAAGHVARAFSENGIELPLRRRHRPERTPAMAPMSEATARTIH